MKKFMLTFLATAVLLILLVPSHYKPKVSALSSWTSGVTLTEEIMPTGLVNRGNLECEYFSPTSKFLSAFTTVSGRVAYSDSTTESAGVTYPDVCMTQNDHGLMSGTIWSPDGDIAESLPVDSGPYTMMPAPGGSTILFTTPAPIFGTQYSINHNWEYIGQLGSRLIGSGIAQKSEKVWKIDTSKLEQFLTYGDGQIVRIDRVGFSSNGRYMVAQLNQRGLVLINTTTKKMTPFAVNASVSGTEPFMTVSNDGRFVAAYYNGKLEVHDISDCAISYEYGQWPSGGALTTAGCQSANYASDLRTAYPLMTNVGRVRFSPHGGSVYVDIGWRGATDFIWKRVRFDANGFESSAHGYLAMGDSYSSGEGDTDGGLWYESGTDEQGNVDTFDGRNLCHLSKRSYPYLMAVELGYLANNSSTPPSDGLFHSVACSGAKMHNVVGVLGEKQDDGGAGDFAVMDNQYRFFISDLFEWQPGFESQVGYVRGRTDNLTDREKFSPEIITLGIGGNDVGFGNFIQACTGFGTCEQSQPGTKKSVDLIKRIAENQNRLVSTYKKVKSEAPNARLYVHGYPQIIEATSGTCANNVHFDAQERLFISYATHYLNEVVKSAATEAGAYYIDVEHIFAGRTLCSGVPDTDIMMNGVTAGNDVRPLDDNSLLAAIGITNGICVRACIGNESYHPRSTGFVVYKDTILQQTDNLSAPMPPVQNVPLPLPDAFFGASALNAVIDLNARNGFPVRKIELREDVITGFAFGSHQMSLNVQTLAPQSTVEVIVESTPLSLGKFSTDSTGRITTIVQLPGSIEPGYHELHILGRDVSGRLVEYMQPFLLGISEADFDGDTVEDDVDSCSAVANIGADIDLDGVDDACDDNPVTPIPPAAPGKPNLQAKSDTGAFQNDTVTSDNTPEFVITCQSNNIVTLYDGESVVGGGTCLNDSVTILSAQLPDGHHANLRARQLDSKGVSSEYSESVSVTVDTIAPVSSVMPDLDTSSDDGVSTSDNITTVLSPIFTGECEDGDVVKLYVDNSLSVESVCLSRAYALTSSNLSLGSHSIQVQFTDLAGNASVLSPSLIITVSDPANDDEDDDHNGGNGEESCQKFRKEEIKCKTKKAKKSQSTILHEWFNPRKMINVHVGQAKTVNCHVVLFAPKQNVVVMSKKLHSVNLKIR